MTCEIDSKLFSIEQLHLKEFKLMNFFFYLNNLSCFFLLNCQKLELKSELALLLYSNKFLQVHLDGKYFDQATLMTNVERISFTFKISTVHSIYESTFYFKLIRWL